MSFNGAVKAFYFLVYERHLALQKFYETAFLVYLRCYYIKVIETALYILLR